MSECANLLLKEDVLGMKSMVQEQQIEELLKQVEELHLSMVQIKENKSLIDQEIITESQILDIILNNYQEVLMKRLDKQSKCG